MTVYEGALAVEVEGVEQILRPGDPEFVLRRGVNHRLYPPRDETSKDPNEKVCCVLSAERIEGSFTLDLVFFENWYAYQEQVVVHGVKMNLIQVLSVMFDPNEMDSMNLILKSQIFDGGDSYLTLPWWVPFRRLVSRGMGIILGRWIGGLLGYQPFYKEWTTDWELACEKMESSLLQKRFAQKSKVV